MNAREVAIESAIADFIGGKYKSQRAAAAAYGIPRTTLQSRLNGSQPTAIAHASQQRLTPDQEALLVDWILLQDSHAQPPTHPHVREVATRILHMNGDYQPLGKLWVPHFIARNPRVASVVGRSIESSRTVAAKHDTIKAFMKLFERTRIELGIQTEDIWNMDETGVALGVCTNSQVIAASSKKKAYKASPEDREWVTILEVISAAGKKLQCLVIFKGKHIQSTWFPTYGTPDWKYTTSKNGWTSYAIGYQWLKDIFIPGSAPRSGGWRLLLVDGHGSHTPIDFMIACKENQIYLLYLPAHASHLLQPLDLAPFSVIKSRYRSQIAALSALDDAAPVKKERFVISYNQAREEGLSERVIRAGWRASGLVPYNPELVLLSSQITGRPVTPPPSAAAQEQQQLQKSRVATPRSAQALSREFQRSGKSSKRARTVVSKAGRALAEANTRAALLEAEVQRLRFQLNKATNNTRVRKQVKPDLNERFVNFNHIEAALAKAAEAEAKKAATGPERAARQAVAQATAVAISSMSSEFQI